MRNKSFRISKNFTSDYYKKFAQARPPIKVWLWLISFTDTLLCIVRGAQKLMFFLGLLEKADSFTSSFFSCKKQLYKTWCTEKENLNFSPFFGVFLTPSTTLLATIITDSLRGIWGTFSSYIWTVFGEICICWYAKTGKNTLKNVKNSYHSL